MLTLLLSPVCENFFAVQFAAPLSFYYTALVKPQTWLFSSNCFLPARLLLPTPETDRRVKSNLQLSSACNEGSPHPPQQPFQRISPPQAPFFSADGCLLLCSENNSHLYLCLGSYSFSAPQEPQAMQVPTFLGLPKIVPSAFSILQSLLFKKKKKKSLLRSSDFL